MGWLVAPAQPRHKILASLRTIQLRVIMKQGQVTWLRALARFRSLSRPCQTCVETPLGFNLSCEIL